MKHSTLFIAALFTLFVVACNEPAKEASESEANNETTMEEEAANGTDMNEASETTDAVTDQGTQIDNGTATPSNDRKVGEGATPAPAMTTVTVIFSSMGEGPDLKALEANEKLNARWVAKTSNRLTSQKIGWGREGETDMCYEVKKLSGEEQTAFLADVKNTFKGMKLVEIKTNVACRSPR